MALLGVQALAIELGVGKGTVSKHATAGKIPVADRDDKGHPLFDVDAVKAAWPNNINPLMRRRGVAVPPPAAPLLDDAAGAADLDDRRSAAGQPRQQSGLLQQQVFERRLRNRRLLRQVGEDEGLFVLRSIADNDAMTLARQTRDGVSAQMADFAGELYAFVGKQPRTEGELRIWLNEHTGKAFDEVEKALAAEKGDEFGDGPGPTDADELEPGEAASGGAA